MDQPRPPLGLDLQTTLDLCRLSNGQLVTRGLDALDLLPPELNAKEIQWIGFWVSNLVERAAPSRDGYSRGRKAEMGVVRMIGSAASIRGDRITAESSVEHLKRQKLSIPNQLAAFMINRRLKKSPQIDLS